jgi:hypothetical protein
MYLLANILFFCFVSVGQRLFPSLKTEQKKENKPANFKVLPCANVFFPI